MISMQNIKQAYLALPPHSPSRIEIYNDNIRSKDHNGQLERAFFATLTYLILQINTKIHHPIMLMVTASHNPPGYNGLKIQSIQENIDLDKKNIEDIINNDQKFIEFLSNHYSQQKTGKNIEFFLARDKRPSSLRLSQIIESVIELFELKLINLEERSTPQLFSLGQFIVENKDISYQDAVQLYFPIIQRSFRESISLISTHLKRSMKTKIICLDFSNGVGGLTMPNYTFLGDYFKIEELNNIEFDKPNVDCGAQWINEYYKEHGKVPDMSKYPLSSQHIFFDGDCDRIIIKLQQRQQIIDGDDLNSMFTTFILQLVSSLDLKGVDIVSVANITSNEGLRQYLSSLKVQLKKVSVGMKNLYNQAKKHDIGCFFQSNGHGSIYFSSQILSKIKEKAINNWQAQLLLNIHNICRNNSRGYALHIFLIFQLFLFFYGDLPGPLFQKMKIIDKTYELNDESLFQNGQDEKKTLKKPKKLVNEIEVIQSTNKQCEILVRKSNTNPILRLCLQGKCKQTLNNVFTQVDRVIIEALNEGTHENK